MATNDLIFNNYFDIEEKLVDAVTCAMGTDIKAVYTPFNVSDMVESSQVTPAVHIIYAGDTIPGAEAGKNVAALVQQRWLVVLAVRHANAQLQDTRQIRSEAGPLILKLLRGLKGIKLTEVGRPLQRIAGAPPVGYSSSFSYFPFLFGVNIIT